MSKTQVTIRMPVTIHSEQVVVFELPDVQLPMPPFNGMTLSGNSIPKVGPLDADFHAYVVHVDYNLTDACIYMVVRGPNRPTETAEEVLEELQHLNKNWRQVARPVRDQAVL